MSDDYITRLREGYAAYQRSVWESYTRAQQAAAEAEQECAAGLFAASGGDDAPQRMNSAWLQYQMDTAKAWYQHWQNVGAQQRELAATTDEVQNAAAAAAHEQYLQSLQSLAGASAGARKDASKEGSSASTGPRRTRGRATGSSG